MKIQIGEVVMDAVTRQRVTYMFENKTRQYLLPALKEYGNEFIDRLNSVYKVAVGIADIVVDNANIKFEKHLFILLETNTAPDFFKGYLEWIREQHMYEDDYVYDNIQKSNMHMIVIKLPEKYYHTIELFKKGKYSEMFDASTIEKYFSNYPTVKKVFIKDSNYKVLFTKKMNRIWGTNIKVDEWEGENDFPPTNETDVFNHHLIK